MVRLPDETPVHTTTLGHATGASAQRCSPLGRCHVRSRSAAVVIMLILYSTDTADLLNPRALQ